MNVNYYCDELISEIVMKFEETQEQFIFQTISDFTSNVYQIEIDKQELIDAITLIRKSRGADIIFKDPKIRLGYVAGYDDGKIDAEREKMRKDEKRGDKMKDIIVNVFAVVGVFAIIITIGMFLLIIIEDIRDYIRITKT